MPWVWEKEDLEAQMIHYFVRVIVGKEERWVQDKDKWLVNSGWNSLKMLHMVVNLAETTWALLLFFFMLHIVRLFTMKYKALEKVLENNYSSGSIFI